MCTNTDDMPGRRRSLAFCPSVSRGRKSGTETPQRKRGLCGGNCALRIINDRMQRRFAQFKLGTDFL